MTTPIIGEPTYCPIIGGNLVPNLEQPEIIGKAQQISMDWKLLQCIKEKCTFWNKERSGCSIRGAADSLMALGDLVQANKGKLSLLNLFSGKKEPDGSKK